VETVGAGVTAWAVGDEVFGSVGKMYFGEGTLAELTTMSEATVARKPASIEHADAAAIPVAGVTALMMVDALAISEGDVVVAIGATGGVGSYFVQLAAKRGARVVAVSRAENADYARRLGAVDVIDYRDGDLVESVRSRYPDGIDSVADMHGGGDVLGRLAEHVRSGGHVTSAVGSADIEALAQRGIEATNIVGMVTTARLEELVGMLERGVIVSPELHPFPLADVGKAIELLGTGHVRGKIVVLP
jgi:NADPH:quinone reductase-like Zn-dependent oxidoreductase